MCPYDSNGNFTVQAGYLAVAGQTIQPSQHNPPLEDIAIGGLSLVLVRDGRAPMTGNLNFNGFKATNLLAGSNALDAVNKTQLDAINNTLTTTTTAIASISSDARGLVLSTNAADPTNDVDISAGAATADTTAYAVMSLASLLTKRIDASWVVGTNQGGLDTGAVGNNVYYVWLIQRSDTGVVDALFSLSATSPTMPTNYDRKRLIGSLARVSGSNTGLYSQLGAFKSIPPLALSGLTEAPFLIPAGTRVVRIYFTALSTTSTVIPQAQIGTASAYAITGYNGSVNSLGSSNVPANTSIGVPLAGAFVAATSIQGYVEFANIGGNTWMATGIAGADNSALNVIMGATVTLSDVATRVRINLTSTTFDAGTAFVVCM